MKVCIAGQGAFGIKHIEAIQKIPGIEIVTLAGGSADSTRDVAQKYSIPHWSTRLDECLAQPGVEAAILATPTQMHAQQGIQCMRAGKHVQVEIPVADKSLYRDPALPDAFWSACLATDPTSAPHTPIAQNAVSHDGRLVMKAIWSGFIFANHDAFLRLVIV